MSLGEPIESTLPDANGMARLENLPAPVVIAAVAGGPVQVPGAGWMLSADFARQGDDLLLVGADGKEVLVKGYFAMATPPDLVSSNGAQLDGGLVVQMAGPLTPAQVAQAGPATNAVAGESIGRVDTLDGTVEAIHSDGTRVTLTRGDPVFQGDTVLTSNNAAVGLIFADNTTFSLGSGGRMVLDEMVYDPSAQAGSFKLQVVLGVFSFVSGQIAKTAPDGMTVSTPVAILGIRGTTVAGKAAAEGEENTITLLPNADGTVGEVTVSNASGSVQVLNAIGATTTVTSNTAAPSPVRTISQAEINQSYGQAINARPAQPDAPPPPDQGQDPAAPTDQAATDLPTVDPLADFSNLAFTQPLPALAPPIVILPPPILVLAPPVVPLPPKNDPDPKPVPVAPPAIYDVALANATISASSGIDTLRFRDPVEIEDAVIDFGTGDLTFTIVQKNTTSPLFSLVIQDHVTNPVSKIDFIDDGVPRVVTLATSLDQSNSTVDTAIAGTTGADSIVGGSGNDILVGNAGDDFLTGNAGNDIFLGGAGNNDYTGGTGIDEIDFFDLANSQGAVVDINAGTATNGFGGSDTFTSIEDVSGTDLADTITGDVNVNLLDGDLGNDVLNGDGGADFLRGGDDNDTFVYNAATDSPNGASLHDTILDFNAGTPTTFVDQLDFTGFGIGALSFVAASASATPFGSATGFIEVRFDDTAKLLQVDSDDNGVIDMEIALPGVAIANLDATDFTVTA